MAYASGLIGVNYGRLANDLPQPTKVVELKKSQGLNRMKLYNTEESVLKAFSGSGIKVVVALPNELLSSVSKEQYFANQWVKDNIFTYYLSTEIAAIVVGNEVFVDHTRLYPQQPYNS